MRYHFPGRLAAKFVISSNRNNTEVKEVPMQRRMIKRAFRQMRSPAKFFAFCKKVQHGLTDNPNLTDSIALLRQQFFEKVDSLETTYHLALDGGRTVIRERENLSQEIVVLLDQIASFLEASFILNPDALLTTGFEVTQERRSPNRVRLPLVAPSDLNVANAGEQGRALATASTFPGALVHEIHINQKDPSVEDDWFHKAIFPDSQKMAIENLPSGNTFFRMRHHGHDGPGPWSGVVSTTIT
jgi:hypothetical protein